MRSCARAASCSSRSATSASRAAAPTSTAATTTCRARPTSARTPTRCPATTASRTGSWQALVRGSGTSTTSGSRSRFACRAMMGKPGHHGVALDRRGAGEERPHRPGFEHPRDVLLGPRAELADPRARDEDGDEQARSAGRDRPVSVGDGGDGGDAARIAKRQVRAEREPRRVPAAGRDAVRDRGLGAPRPTARSSGARR